MNTLIVVAVAIAVAILGPLWYGQRQARLAWISTVIDSALTDPDQVEFRRLFKYEYDDLKNNRTNGESPLGERSPSSDVWQFKLTSPGGTTIRWYTRPKTGELLRVYTTIGHSRETLSQSQYSQLATLGGMAYTMHKMAYNNLPTDT